MEAVRTNVLGAENVMKLQSPIAVKKVVMLTQTKPYTRSMLWVYLKAMMES